MRAFLLVTISLMASGCARHRATPSDCAAILDRLVDLELSESGYRDPVVRARWQDDLRQRFSPDLEHCRKMTVPDDLVSCLATTNGAEDLTHRCLR
jgi:hypothetical protein